MICSITLVILPHMYLRSSFILNILEDVKTIDSYLLLSLTLTIIIPKQWTITDRNFPSNLFVVCHTMLYATFYLCQLVGR